MILLTNLLNLMLDINILEGLLESCKSECENI